MVLELADKRSECADLKGKNLCYTPPFKCVCTQEWYKKKFYSPQWELKLKEVTHIYGIDFSYFSIKSFEHFRVCYHRLENKCVLRHIYNMNFHSWVVLGSQGCREKKIQTAISMLLLKFSMIFGQKINLIVLKNTLASALKSYMKWSYKKWQFLQKNS